jgi:hypothetical protein
MNMNNKLKLLIAAVALASAGSAMATPTLGTKQTATFTINAEVPVPTNTVTLKLYHKQVPINAGIVNLGMGSYVDGGQVFWGALGDDWSTWDKTTDVSHMAIEISTTNMNLASFDVESQTVKALENSKSQVMAYTAMLFPKTVDDGVINDVSIPINLYANVKLIQPINLKSYNVTTDDSTIMNYEIKTLTAGQKVYVPFAFLSSSENYIQNITAMHYTGEYSVSVKPTFGS